MARSVEIFALVHLVLFGVSHIWKHAAWAEFFMVLSEKGRPGVFLHGFLSLWFGSVVVAFHWVWQGPASALTAWGCLLILKAMHCFLFPDAALRSLRKVSRETSWKFIPAGVIYLVIAGPTAYALCR